MADGKVVVPFQEEITVRVGGNGAIVIEQERASGDPPEAIFVHPQFVPALIEALQAATQT